MSLRGRLFEKVRIRAVHIEVGDDLMRQGAGLVEELFAGERTG